MTPRRPYWLIAALLLGVGAALVFFLRDPVEEGPLPLSPQATGRSAAPEPSAARQAGAPMAPKSEEAPGAPQGEIEGRVISAETRAGISNAELTWSSERGAHSVSSDADGRFTFRPPRAGAYQLAEAQAEGFLPFGPEWGKSAMAVELRPGQRVRGLSVELIPAPDIVGRVLDAKGARVPRASVRVLVPRKDEIALFPMRDRFTTDAQGEFVFRAEPNAVVEAFHPALGSGSERLERGAKELVITLEPGPADAGARVSMSGVVLESGKPVAGALVHVASALRVYPRVFGSLDGYRELTDDQGRFEVTELQPGTYDVSAHLIGTAPAHRFDLAAPAKDLVLELGSGPKLSGKVTNEGGAAVPSFEVTLSWKKAPLERLQIIEASFVDPEGRYAIEGVAPGSYELEVRAFGFNASIAPLTLATRDETADVVLSRGVRATGTVRSGETRTPIAKAKVTLESGGVPAITDELGTFALDGMPRDGFSLRAAAEGHHTRLVTVTEPLKPIEIELTPAAPDAGVVTELLGIGAVLRGRGDALVVGEVMPTGGAAVAGIVPGDEVVAVDGKKVTELGFEAAIRAIRGPIATQVVLSLRKAATPPPVDVVVTRRKISN